MGAYSNPETVIDTQSGQHFRNLMSTVTNSATDVLKTIQIRKKEADDKANELITKQISSTNELVGKVNSDPNIKLNAAGTKIKNSMSALVTDAVSNDLTKSKTATDKIQTIQLQSKQTMTNGLGEYHVFLDNIKKAQENGTGVEGGVYTGTPKDQRDFMDNFTYNKESNIEFDFASGEDGSTDFTNMNITHSITGMDGVKKPFPFSTSAITNINKQRPNGDWVIPSTNKEAVKAKISSVFNIKNDAKGNPVVQDGLADTLLGNLEYGEFASAPVGGKRTDLTTGKLLQAGHYKIFRMNRDKVAEEPGLISQARAYVDGMLKTDPKGLAMQYNDILLKNSKDFHPIDNVSDKTEITEMTDYITKAYARHLVYDQFPNPDVIMKDANGDPVIETQKYVKPTQPKGSGGGKVTQADKKQQAEIAYVKERYAKVKDGNGDYALSTDGKIRLINGKLVRIVKDPSLPNAPADEIPLTASERAKYGF